LTLAGASQRIQSLTGRAELHVKRKCGSMSRSGNGIRRSKKTQLKSFLSSEQDTKKVTRER
jgi:hypothetical protein